MKIFEFYYYGNILHKEYSTGYKEMLSDNSVLFG